MYAVKYIYGHMKNEVTGLRQPTSPEEQQNA